jgi:FMN-dependent NADH-azoreductase
MLPIGTTRVEESHLPLWTANPEGKSTMNVLYVTSSPRGADSYSTRVANDLIGDIRRDNPGAQIQIRDLAADPLPHLDADFIAATRGPNGPQTERQRALLARSDVLVDELLAADTVIIAAPMINFSIPSTLKSWIDFISRPGRTFSYSEAGPKGLATGKRVAIIVARGGVYAGDKQGFDFQRPYLLGVLGFLGMTNVDVIEVDGTAFGPEAAEKSVAAATEKVHAACARAAAAA